MSRGIVYPLPTLLSKARPRSKELLDSPGLVERYPLQIRLSSRATFGEGVLLRAKNLSTRKVTMFDATHKSVVDVIFDEIEELIMLELDIEQPTYEVKLLNLEVDDYKATELTCPVCAKVIQKAFARHVRQCSWNSYCLNCETFISGEHMAEHFSHCVLLGVRDF